MKFKWQQKFNISDNHSIVYLVNNQNSLDSTCLTGQEKDYARHVLEDGEKIVWFNRFYHFVYLIMIDENLPDSQLLEDIRKKAAKIQKLVFQNKQKQVLIADLTGNKYWTLACAEGMALASYKFLKYVKISEEKFNYPEIIWLNSIELKLPDVDDIQNICDAVFICRNLINEPASFLTTSQMSAEFKLLAKDAGFKIRILDKAKINKAGMGGLLAVNRGSTDPPAFHILEYKPKNCINEKPIVLVGKGIVFDTGGMSLKPTKDSMDYMKSDMSGAAAVACSIYYAAKAGMPLHLIGLIPATDNRTGSDAYVPGDVIRMHNGFTVEVKNTDAEGRLILADALSYASQYKPEIIVELSTLTGSASIAIGKYGIVCMGNAGQKWFDMLKNAGQDTYERLVEFPFWDEYNELLKSDIADLKNVGGRDGGAITAGKFLAYFTQFPFIHLDIAGPAFVSLPDSYRGKGGTGIGVRLLAQFMKKYIRQRQSE